MLSEDKLIKRMDPPELQLDVLTYRCKYLHELEYKPKSPGKTIQSINCPHCLARGDYNIPMNLVSKKKG